MVWRRVVLASVLVLLPSLLLAPQDSLGISPMPTRVDHAPILIEGDAGFTAVNGVTAGSGTPEDPYVLEGWRLVIGRGATGIEIRNTTASFVIRNVDVGPSATSGPGGLAITLDNVTSAAIEDSTLDNTDRGLRVSDSRAIRVVNTTIRITPVPATLNALALDRTKDILLRGIEVTGGAPEGLSAHSVSNLTVEGSTFYDIGAAAVWARDSVGLTFRGNAFLRNAQGISMGNATDLLFDSNLFYQNRDGIQLAGARNATIVGNEFRESQQTGITFVDDLRFPGPTVGVRVVHNRFEDSVHWHVSDSGRSDVLWDDGYPEGGNHWSGFVAPDRCRGPLQGDCSNRDGIVDVPYTGWNALAFAGHVDRYPLVRPYTDSRSPPVASFSVRPDRGDSETTFEFDASGSTDAEDPKEFLEVRWDFDGDFVFDTDWSDHLQTVHRYPGPDVYLVRVEVRDTSGSSAVHTSVLVVDPVPIRWTFVAAIVWAIAFPVVIGTLLWLRRKSRGPSAPESEPRP